jgi:hypothetical protein
LLEACDRPRNRPLQGSSRDRVAPAESRSALLDGRGWTRTSSLLFVRQALIPLSYSPLRYPGRGSNPHGPCPRRSRRRASASSATWIRVPGQGIEPRSPRSERGVLPVRRSRSDSHVSVQLLPPRPQQVDAVERNLPDGGRADARTSYVQAARLPFDPGSPSRQRARRSNGVLRGGALEPEPRTRSKKPQAKAHAK